MALAIHDFKLPYNQLSLEFNFPTPYSINPNFNPDDIFPLIIHYHHLVSNYGNLMYSRYVRINKCIDFFNNSFDNTINEDNELIVDDLYLTILNRHADKE